jgi:hypothetical protein
LLSERKKERKDQMKSKTGSVSLRDWSIKNGKGKKKERKVSFFWGSSLI